LYDLYKTSTVREIEHFKTVLASVQLGVLDV
jgi:ABC-type taurine transport system ATPase subunit